MRISVHYINVAGDWVTFLCKPSISDFCRMKMHVQSSLIIRCSLLFQISAVTSFCRVSMTSPAICMPRLHSSFQTRPNTDGPLIVTANEIPPTPQQHTAAVTYRTSMGVLNLERIRVFCLSRD
jgi:hypothetical protein